MFLVVLGLMYVNIIIPSILILCFMLYTLYHVVIIITQWLLHFTSWLLLHRGHYYIVAIITPWLLCCGYSAVAIILS